MDRNSLLAFLLIAVIIFLMPEYYKLVYPPQPFTDSLVVDNEKMVRAVAPSSEKTIPPPSYYKPGEGAREFSVITNLYSANISSINGGSLSSFVLHNYALNDSESVELIDNCLLYTSPSPRD